MTIKVSRENLFQNRLKCIFNITRKTFYVLNFFFMIHIPVNQKL